MATKRHVEEEEDHSSGEEEEEEEENATESSNVPARIKILKRKKEDKRLIVVLESASLEAVKIGKNYDLLNSDDHQTQLKKFKRDPTSCRPDIAHQCLLMLMDSPLNRAGLLQVYVHTDRNILIEIHPQTRIPRTLKRFSGLMVQLLHKMRIRAVNKPYKLLQIIKNPITDHFPSACLTYSTSCHAKQLVNPRDIVPKEDEPIVIVVGAMAHGKLNVSYAQEEISISQYPLSAALTCAKLCSAFEEVWGIH